MGRKDDKSTNFIPSFITMQIGELVCSTSFWKICGREEKVLKELCHDDVLLFVQGVGLLWSNGSVENRKSTLTILI